MKAVAVYEPLWGNTARTARAIAEGIGPEARALSTAEATAATIADADLIVAGAPVLGFKLSSEKMRESVSANPGKAPTPPDLSHPAMRVWLDASPAGQGASAAFDTRARSLRQRRAGDRRGAGAGWVRLGREARRLRRRGQVRPAARRRGRTRAGVGSRARSGAGVGRGSAPRDEQLAAHAGRAAARCSRPPRPAP